MTTQIFLIAPRDPDPIAFGALLTSTLAAAPVSALLVPRGTLAENAYKSLIKALVPITQAQDCALLVEGDPGLARLLNADGVHVNAPAPAVAEAIGTLKPGLIVGAGPVTSRHDAMTLGEMDPDYLFFGAMEGPTDPASAALAQWWAQTMEIPAVLADLVSPPASINAQECEFIALGDNIWNAPQGPQEALAACALALKGKTLESQA